MMHDHAMMSGNELVDDVPLRLLVGKFLKDLVLMEKKQK